MAEVKAASLGREDCSSRCGETIRMREAQEESPDVSEKKSDWYTKSSVWFANRHELSARAFRAR